MGNSLGPLDPCDKASYIFTSPHKAIDLKSKILSAG